MRTLWIKSVLITLLIMSAAGLSACRNDKPSAGFKPVGNVFDPKSSQQLNKLDILWVIDNSGSMAAAQANLAANMSSFVSTFQSRGYNYKLAVTGTDAYTASSVFRSVGSCNASYTPCSTGTSVVTPSTPNYLNTFVNNALIGTSGGADERAFSSMTTAFANGSNAGFIRSDSFVAVIILSDEDDFSRSAGADTHDYNNVNLYPISTYITALDTLTGTTGIYRRYSVSTITADTVACSLSYYGGAKLDAQGNQYLGTRYMDLASQTNGVIGSICDASYANALANISAQITVLSTQFQLERPANPSTIYVAFDGVKVPQDATNGWTYSASLQAVQFHGTYTPTQNTNIFVDYLPAY